MQLKQTNETIYFSHILLFLCYIKVKVYNNVHKCTITHTLIINSRMELVWHLQLLILLTVVQNIFNLIY